MSNLQIFNNSEFGDMEVLIINGKEYFPATKCAIKLGYSNPRKAIQVHCKGVTKWDTPSGGGAQETNFIPEGDLYRLIIRSKLPAAERFEKWVFEDVLPKIRQTGNYSIESRKLIALALVEAQKVIEEQDQQIALMAPKAEFYDAVAGSSNAIPIAEAAKVLNMGIGQNNLFKFLRDQGILMRNNQPYQEFIDRGYFRVIEQKYDVRGETRIYIKTLIYQKGLDYIRRLLQCPKKEKLQVI